LSSHGAHAYSAPQLASEDDILKSLQACDLAAWKNRAAALPTHCASALSEAIREAKPKARRVSLPGATIETEAELEAWLSNARESIQQAMKEGPAIV
jgi:hypothetical protein